MRILSVYYTHKPGGFCKRLYQLLSAAHQRGLEVHYLTLDPPPRTLNEGVQLHLIPFPLQKRGGLLFWGLFTLWCPLYCAWKAFSLKPDLLLAFSPYYGACFALVRILFRKRLIVFLRALSFKIDRITEKPLPIRLFASWFERMGIGLADQIVCMSEAMQMDLQEFLGKELSNVSILPNNVPKIKKSLSVLAEAPLQSELIVLTAGVIDQRKNIEFLLQCFKHIQDFHQKSIEQIALLIAGDGPKLESSVQLAEQLELENVRFLGWVDDLSRYFQTSSLLVHPSLHEGSPNVVLEALAYDLPVLVSDIPELRELMHFPELTFDLLEPHLLGDRLAFLSRDGHSLQSIKELCLQRKQALSFDWNQRALDILTS